MKLFEPGKIGRLAVKNRLVMASMGTMFHELDGGISERAIPYFVERARGGVGLITTGCIRVENTIEKLPAVPRIHPLAIARFDELVASVHDYNAKIAIQLTAGFGRVAAPGALEGRAVAPSALPYFWNLKLTARALKTQEVEKLVEAFGHAAEMTNSAGFDAIELHGHEGYLLDQFMTSLWNKRTDKYGGDLNGRLRFPLEVIESIKDRVGRDFPIIYRYGVKHYIEGGRDVEESLEIAKRLEKAGVDAIHADAGCYERWYWAHPPTYQKHGCMVDMAEAVKRVVRIPVIAVGRLGDPDLAEKTLQEGKADFIALGRALLADPEWLIKVKEGRLDDIRPCIGDHDGCFKRVIEKKYLTCTVNPAAGNEREFRITQAKEPKSVVVVGGGVAGMEAARVAALRGHEVTLYEKRDELGGHLIAGSVPGFKQDLKKLRDYLATQLRKLDVTIRLKQEITEELVEKLRPEVVIVATGSTPFVPEIPGIEKDIVVTAEDVLLGERKIGDVVAIAGGGLVGCETALHLAQKGKKVTIVEMLEDVALDLFTANRQQLLQMLHEENVNVLTNTSLVEIANEGPVILIEQGKRMVMKSDAVVLALGLKPERTLFKALEDKVPELYAVGDCVEPRKIIEAIHEAFRTVRLF